VRTVRVHLSLRLLGECRKADSALAEVLMVDRLAAATVLTYLQLYLKLTMARAHGKH